MPGGRELQRKNRLSVSALHFHLKGPRTSTACCKREGARGRDKRLDGRMESREWRSLAGRVQNCGHMGGRQEPSKEAPVILFCNCSFAIEGFFGVNNSEASFFHACGQDLKTGSSRCRGSNGTKINECREVRSGPPRGYCRLAAFVRVAVQPAASRLVQAHYLFAALERAALLSMQEWNVSFLQLVRGGLVLAPI